MAKTANVFTRVEPKVKEQAEAVLNQLGIPMATAMNMFLQQVALQRGIPFEMKLPQANPIAYGSLSDEEFNLLMERAMHSYADGKCTDFDTFKKDISRELDL